MRDAKRRWHRGLAPQPAPSLEEVRELIRVSCAGAGEAGLRPDVVVSYNALMPGVGVAQHNHHKIYIVDETMEGAGQPGGRAGSGRGATLGLRGG